MEKIILIGTALLVLTVLAVLLLISGCGTAVYRNLILVQVEDPGGRLGGPPWEVAVYSPASQGIYAVPDAFRGTAYPDQPYETQVSGTKAAFFWQSQRPDEVALALVVPALDAEGFYRAVLPVQAGAELEGMARYVPFGNYFPEENARTLSFVYRCSKIENGWRIEIRLGFD